jgi:hypothetical protein
LRCNRCATRFGEERRAGAASDTVERFGRPYDHGVDTPPLRPYRMPVRPMELRPDIDLTHALQFADALEDEEHVRKLDKQR